MAVWQLIDPVSGLAREEVQLEAPGEVIFARLDGEDLTTALFVGYGTHACCTTPATWVARRMGFSFCM